MSISCAETRESSLRAWWSEGLAPTDNDVGYRTNRATARYQLIRTADWADDR